MDTSEDKPSHSELRGLRFQYNQHFATLNTGTIMALFFFSGSLKHGELSFKIWILALFCFVTSFIVAIYFMKQLADGERLKTLFHNSAFYLMFVGILLTIIFMIRSSQEDERDKLKPPANPPANQQAKP